MNAKQTHGLRPERRSSFRIVTLKNAGWVTLALVVLFITYTSYMEHRSRGTSDYGRLYDDRIEATTAAPAPPPQP